jgi:hypothetical protein
VADQIEVPLAYTRDGATWDFCLREENNSPHILIREHLADGSIPVIPEDPGLPAAILCGPNATIKIRKQTLVTPEILPTFGKCLEVLYQGKMHVTEALRATERAMVGSIGNNALSEVIQGYNRLQAKPVQSGQVHPQVRSQWDMTAAGPHAVHLFEATRVQSASFEG